MRGPLYFSGRLRYWRRLKEHQTAPVVCYPKHSAAREHSINQEQRIHFEDTEALASLSHYGNRIIGEAIEISLHQNFDREWGYQLSPAQDKISETLKRQSGVTSTFIQRNSCNSHSALSLLPVTDVQLATLRAAPSAAFGTMETRMGDRLRTPCAMFSFLCTRQPSEREVYVNISAFRVLLFRAGPIQGPTHSCGTEIDLGGTVLQTGRSRVRYPMRWIFKFT
jgi:hypothetical protein